MRKRDAKTKELPVLKPGEFWRNCDHEGCTEKGKAKLKDDQLPSIPKNWKQFKGRLYCPKCARKLYHIRAITFQMKGPVDQTQKDEFFKLLRIQISQIQMLKNWLIAEYKMRDIRKVPGMDRLPKWECPYLYREAVALFPDLPPPVVVAVDNTVKAEYGAKRLNALWFRTEQFPEYSGDQPMPIPAQVWHASYVKRPKKTDSELAPKLKNSTCAPKDEDGMINVPTLVLPIGRKSYRVELKSGKVWWPQMATFDKIIEGTVQGCQLLVLPKDKGFNLKLVAWFPSDTTRKNVSDNGKTLLVTTDSASLLVFTLAKDDLQRYNGDQFVRWSREEMEINDRVTRSLAKWQKRHDRRLMRLREDQKTCRRIPAPDPASFRERLVEKHHRRFKTGIEKLANVIVNKANQCRCDTISFVLKKEQLLPHFPWFKLQQMLEQRVARNGIQLSWIDATNPGKTESETELAAV